MTDLLLLIGSTILLLAGLAITYLIHSRYQLEITVQPTPPPAPSVTPTIAVIIPARNEARNIRRCVEALLAQTYPNYELTVIDDRSNDATPQILVQIQALHPHLHILEGEELLPGWAGKPHALAQGAAKAKGEWLCFVDADTFARPELLTSALAAAQTHQADLFTILTGQELGSFWEKVILPLVFTALSFGFPARQVNDPNRPEAIANGQFILVRRAVYEATGGHAAIRARIDEDKALAERVKHGGYRLIVADGRAVARTRMYTSFAEIWEGWTKNIFLGMRDRLGLLLFGGVVGVLGALALPLWLIAGVAWFAVTGSPVSAVVAAEAALLWAYLLWIRARVARAMEISPLYALTLPLGALVFTAMMFASAVNVLSGKGVTWKGRTYQ